MGPSFDNGSYDVSGQELIWHMGCHWASNAVPEARPVSSTHTKRYYGECVSSVDPENVHSMLLGRLGIEEARGHRVGALPFWSFAMVAVASEVSLCEALGCR